MSAAGLQPPLAAVPTLPLLVAARVPRQAECLPPVAVLALSCPCPCPCPCPASATRCCLFFLPLLPLQLVSFAAGLGAWSSWTGLLVWLTLAASAWLASMMGCLLDSLWLLRCAEPLLEIFRPNSDGVDGWRIPHLGLSQEGHEHLPLDQASRPLARNLMGSSR